MSSANRYSNVIELRERNLQISEIAQHMECSERTVRRLLEQGARSEQRIVDFESAWRDGNVPKIEDYVPSQGNLSRQEILNELVSVDIEYRWRQQDLARTEEASTGLSARPRIEDYVVRFPELVSEGQLPANLITEEFRVRMKWGDHPDYDEYQERFPNRKNSLTQQLDRVHNDLDTERNLVQSDDNHAGADKAGETRVSGPSQDSTSNDDVDHRSRPTLNLNVPPPAPAMDTSANGNEKYSTRAEPKKGGMAIVWRAFDSHLHREVAYKELRPDRTTDAEYLKMFLHEAQVTGQLEHPNIVPVYELGKDFSDERPFYTMKYVRGGTLTEVIDDYHKRRKENLSDRLDLHRLLNIFMDVCHALRYAHSRGVLHRDLKPDNVMVGDYGEVLVVDWGLAKVMGVSDDDLPAVKVGRADRLYTQVGSRKGTPGYWAPEQAEGRADLIDVRTDVYGLGGILFQILTGQIPNPGDEEDSTNAIERGNNDDPHDLEASAPAALGAVCVKAMSPERADRYAKVDELIDDIERWRVDEPVSAYRETIVEQAIRLVRRNWMATAVLVFGLVTLILVFTSLQIMREIGRQSIVEREIKTLSNFASSQEAKLMTRINVLRQDVTFLASLPEVRSVLKPKNSAADPKQTAEPKPETDTKKSPQSTQENDPKQRLATVFEQFLRQRPEYMQVRLIRKDGQELVRVLRNSPEGDVRIEDKKLPNKKGRPYFDRTMQTLPGDWYLSSIGLNQENHKKQKDLPVIRGAIPVFVNETPAGENDDAETKATTLEGIVIINLHFRKLVSDLRDFESRSASGLVYLTDAQGRFLYHPQPDIAFCFERKLNYQIQHLYPGLIDVYRSGNKQHVSMDETPQIALFIKPDLDQVHNEKAIWKTLSDELAAELIAIDTVDNTVESRQGEEGDAIIFGVDKDQLEQIAEDLRTKLSVKIDARILGAKLADVQQAVHYNRLNLEPGNDQRALGLALVVPHHSLEAETSGYQRLFWGTLVLLTLVIIPLVYIVARRAPTNRAVIV